MANESKRSVKPTLAVVDPTWERMCREAADMAGHSPLLASFLHATVLNHDSFEMALSYQLAQKLGSQAVSALIIREVFDEAMKHTPDIGQAARADIIAVFNRDPACTTYAEPFLYFKGYHALQAYRMSHWLWLYKGKPLAMFLQNRMSEVFGVDIHPAAKIGRGVMIDHATSIVIGETAVVEDDVSMLHEVTLGGTGKESGDRHPKIRKGVMIGAGAKVLGNVEVGHCSRVGAGSVVLQDVPPNKTVAGVPAKIVGEAGCDNSPSHMMDQSFLDGEIDGSSI